PMATTGPSHATRLTSLYPLSHGFVRNGQRLSEDHVTIAERLRAAGYRTSGVVSSFVLKSTFGFAQGFGSFDARLQAEQSTTRLGEWEGIDVTGKGFDRRANLTTDVAIAWLAERQKDRPFFLWVDYYDPHGPYDRPPPFDRRFPPATDDPLGR